MFSRQIKKILSDYAWAKFTFLFRNSKPLFQNGKVKIEHVVNLIIPYPTHRVVHLLVNVLKII